MKLAKDQIARQFSRAASTYDLAAQLQYEMAEELIGEIPAEQNGRLVDLGCGTGWALSQLAQMNRFELIGIDIAPGMIEIAQARVPAAQFHCCDLEETPLASSMADVVFSNAALQWCDIEAAVREMHRICKPGGSVVFSTFGPDTLTEIRAAWHAAGDQMDRIHHFETAEAIETIVKRVGFTPIKVVPVERKLTYHSVDALLQSIKQLGATNASVGRHTGLLGTKRFQTFRDVFEIQLARDGYLELTFECIFSVAKKS